MASTMELKTINAMLATIGEAPVSSVDSENSDALIARDTLREVSRDVQIRGWIFNVDRAVTLVPDGPTRHILLPEGLLDIDGDSTDKYRQVSQRGGKLYDRDAHTFTFDSPVIVKMTLELDYSDLPAIAQKYIKIKASRIFQQRVVGSETLSSFSQLDEQRAWSELLDLELENLDSRVVTTSRSVGGSSWL